MRLWIVQVGEPLPVIDGPVRESRCALLTRWAQEAGHSVLRWSSVFSHQEKRFRAPEPATSTLGPRLEVRLLSGPGYQRNRSLRRLRHHRIEARAFAQAARQVPKPDLVFCALPTLDLAEQAVRYGTEAGVPVVIDVNDRWPDHYLVTAPKWLRPILRPLLWTEYRRLRGIMRGARAMTAVSRTFLEWGARHAGRPVGGDDAVFPIGSERMPTQGTAAERIAQREGELRNSLAIKPEQSVVVFVGSFAPSFAFGPVMEAAKELESSGKLATRFVLAGAGAGEKSLRRAAARLGNITFTGWLPDRYSVWALLRLSAVGLAPYRSDGTVSLPNKPFEYMAAGLPQVSSLAGEMAQIIEQARIGLNYQADRTDSLVRCLDWLGKHPQERALMGQGARALFGREYSADVVYPQLLKHLEQVIGSSSRSNGRAREAGVSVAG